MEKAVRVFMYAAANVYVVYPDGPGSRAIAISKTGEVLLCYSMHTFERDKEMRSCVEL